MYLSKESVINLFFQMNFLYSGEDIQKQGGTQFYSELKYFLALDEFVASEKRPCNTREKDDKQKFINNVGHVVQLSSPDAETSLDAKNFFDSFGVNKDFDVGSNFFSAGAVNKSLTSTSPLPFPSRHPQLLKCENGVIDIADGAYQRFANEQDYLYYQDRKKKIVLPNKKAILFFWLNRNTSFTNKNTLLNDFLNSLQMRYSQNMINSLGWNKNDSVYINIAKCLTTSENISFLEKEDLIFDSKDWLQRKKYFETWLCLNSSGDDGFRAHCVDVCEQWLEKKLPGNQIGNLFRYKDYDSYKKERDRIMNLKDFESVSNSDGTGRPRSAINHYLNFLNRMPRMDKVADDDFIKLLKILEQEIEKNPERIEALRKMLPQEHKDAVSPLSSDYKLSQIIYYGVPGCGKSNKIREKLKNVPEKNKVRVVFHPEYTNAEFIGQILPKVNGHVTYEFTPGPFTQIIKRAYLNPKEHFYLVIEEINRGNAAAIFGDTFQLLDRLKAGETDSLGNDPANSAVNTFTEGWSQYFVQNDDINAYIRKATRMEDDSYQERNEGVPVDEIEINSIHFKANTAIRLPPNLSILATMNTSDQNVFTLDNAFQRRFDMKLVRNEFDLTQPAVNAQYEAEIDDTGIKWGKFWGWINAKITATLKGLSSTEDKRLGVWFVSNVNGIIDDKIFAEKVLKFLWDDVFKFKRPQVFKAEIDTLEKLINFFENPPEGSERFGVFKDMDDLKTFEASPTL